MPPAAANRARSGTSAALWNRPPPTTAADGDDRDLVAASRQEQGRPEAAPVAEVVEHDHARARASRGRRARRGCDTRRGGPRRAGDRPSAARAGTRRAAVATRSPRSTSSAPDGRDVVRVGATSRAGRRRRAPSSRRSYQARRSEDLVARRLPAGEPELPAELAGSRSSERHAVAALGRDPRRLEAGRPAADDQHATAAVAAGANRSPPHSNSRPADGLTRQEIQ